MQTPPVVMSAFFYFIYLKPGRENMNISKMFEHANYLVLHEL